MVWVLVIGCLRPEEKEGVWRVTTLKGVEVSAPTFKDLVTKVMSLGKDHYIKKD